MSDTVESIRAQLAAMTERAEQAEAALADPLVQSELKQGRAPLNWQEAPAPVTDANTVLSLNEYQRSNLLWLMTHAKPHANSGDWFDEIRMQLTPNETGRPNRKDNPFPAVTDALAEAVIEAARRMSTAWNNGTGPEEAEADRDLRDALAALDRARGK